MFKSYLIACLVLLSTALSAQTEVRFYTTLGEFDVQVREDLVPITAGNFIGLVNDEFYDGIIFHRVIGGFIIQGGDPTGTGAGGSGIIIPDEFTDSLSNIVRTISMANAGPNTGTSQFFINMVNNVYLDYDQDPLTSAHPVFGEVIEGWPIVIDISQVATDGAGRPLTDVVMDSLRIVNAPTGIQAPSSFADYRIIGNPLTEASLLQIDVNEGNTLLLEMIDMQSRKVIASKQVNVLQGENQIPVGTMASSQLVPGTYFLTITSASGETRALKFIR